MNDLIGINSNHTLEMSKALNKLLSEYQLYYQNLRIFHWNVKGPNFFRLHEYFENLYKDARTNIDDIAERILTLGEKPVGHWSSYLDIADIEEASHKLDDVGMVTAVLDNHRIIIDNMRRSIGIADNIKDESTADMLIAMMQDIEKSSWMLNSWKQGIESKSAVTA